MRRVFCSMIVATVMGGAAFVSAPPAALAATQDGNWTVLIVTEKGNCDRGYRYDVRIANGHVSYEGGAAVDLAGTVANNGAISVSIKAGEKGASGTGHLSSASGSGTWHGSGANGSNCAGRWEAVRR